MDIGESAEVLFQGLFLISKEVLLGSILLGCKKEFRKKCVRNLKNRRDKLFVRACNISQKQWFSLLSLGSASKLPCINVYCTRP